MLAEDFITFMADCGVSIKEECKKPSKKPTKKPVESKKTEAKPVEKPRFVTYDELSEISNALKAQADAMKALGERPVNVQVEQQPISLNVTLPEKKGGNYELIRDPATGRAVMRQIEPEEKE